MPGKNKPKRLDRNHSWRVQRRKKKQRELSQGTSRVRKPRPKKVKSEKIVEAPKEAPKKKETKKKE